MLKDFEYINKAGNILSESNYLWNMQSIFNLRVTIAPIIYEVNFLSVYVKLLVYITRFIKQKLYTNLGNNISSSNSCS